MTLLDERAPAAADEAPAAGPEAPAGPPPAAVRLTGLAVALAGSAVGWMLGAVFQGALARLLAAAAAVVGAGLVVVGQRSRRPAVWQALALPLGAGLGALVVLPSTTGGSANLPGLVAEAVRAGGLAEPPVPFEPGWRFLLVLLLVPLTTGAAALGVGLGRPRLGVAALVPVLVGAALVQPPATAPLTSAVALLLVVAALVVASGAQLVQEGASSTGFEARRLLRGAAAVALLAAVVVPLSQAGLLFPTDTSDRVVPPQRPHAEPPLSDRVLFTVTSSAPGDTGPWRTGVLDVYDGRAWRLPPYDPARIRRVGGDGDLARAAGPGRPGDGPSGIPAAGGAERRVTVTVGDLPGRVLPAVEGERAVVDRDLDVGLDPRTQVLRSARGRPRAGSRYTLVATAPPDAAALLRAPAPDTAALAPYLQVPAPPVAVADLLAAAPAGPPFRRLQYVRNALAARVVAAGEGTPVEVPPDRVAAMLSGSHASPYEIVAAEALLARWAGVPARIGYGYVTSGGAAAGRPGEVHPRDGATWLEAWFPGPGWVSVVGRPPHVQASTDLRRRRQTPAVASGLSVVVHVPVALSDGLRPDEVARYWALVALPWVLLVALAVAGYPAALKELRRWRRHRWARRRGHVGRLLVAYAELRDRLHDLGAAQPEATPLEFCHAVAWDEEHWELAWLVSRALWGDLRRDLRADDAAAAEAMSRSVGVRAARAQRPVARVRGRLSRRSLLEPWTRDLPNAWPSLPLRRAGRATGAWLRRFVTARLSPLRPQGALLLVVAALLGLAGCGPTAPAAVPPPLPARLAPVAVGGYSLQREPGAERAFAGAGRDALVSDGHVWTVRRGAEVLGSLQAAQFLPRAGSDRTSVERALRQGLGGGGFAPVRVGGVPLQERREDGGRLLLYFPPGGGWYLLLDARNGFDDAEQVLAGVVGYATGRPLVDAGATLPDPRRGGDG